VSPAPWSLVSKTDVSHWGRASLQPLVRRLRLLQPFQGRGIDTLEFSRFPSSAELVFTKGILVGGVVSQSRAFGTAWTGSPIVQCPFGLVFTKGPPPSGSLDHCRSL
jgi:hypothetical protein